MKFIKEYYSHDTKDIINDILANEEIEFKIIDVDNWSLSTSEEPSILPSWKEMSQWVGIGLYNRVPIKVICKVESNLDTFLNEIIELTNSQYRNKLNDIDFNPPDYGFSKPMSALNITYLNKSNPILKRITSLTNYEVKFIHCREDRHEHIYYVGLEFGKSTL